jgi:26S proteasome regulatory subunit N3
MNRRTLDQLAARIYCYYSRFHELQGLESFASIRPTLLAAQQIASLKHDWESHATLLNLVLRNYYAENLIDQADKLIARVKFPEGTNNNQLARWLYYVGRLRAIQLKYTEAHTLLQQAVRRAPQATSAAAGFYQAVHKLSIVVELLMGDIPARALFRHPVLERALQSYLPVVQAVRVGDLQAFTAHLAASAAQFRTDGTYTLIARLRHNVIKTALRTISLAYSRIPLRTICAKLGLDSEEEAEYMVAKAIRDGVVEAHLDHEKGYMMSAEVRDVYATAEPMRAFDERIRFCLNLRNDSVKVRDAPSFCRGADMKRSSYRPCGSLCKRTRRSWRVRTRREKGRRRWLRSVAVEPQRCCR